MHGQQNLKLFVISFLYLSLTHLHAVGVDHDAIIQNVVRLECLMSEVWILASSSVEEREF